MKQDVLKILKQHEGDFISGQAISAQLGVTRAAVWKWIQQLRQDGYGIESVSNHGYKLTALADALTKEELGDFLKTQLFGKHIVHLPTVDSTNNYAKILAGQGESEGTVVVAEMQTGGRGCAGRQWACQPQQGIWMSVILRPNWLDMPSVPLITQMACAAVGQAVKPLVGDVSVQWPNDIVLNGKKVAGVLTESSGEIDQLDYVVVGIGINVNQAKMDFPAELLQRATSLRMETSRMQSRQKLFCAVLELLERMYSRCGLETALEYCKSHSATIGHHVSFYDRGTAKTGIVVSMDAHGGLLVKLDSGEEKHLFTAHSIKILK